MQLQNNPLTVLLFVCAASFFIKLSLIDMNMIDDGQTYYNLSFAFAKDNHFYIEDSPYLHNLGFPLVNGMLMKLFDYSLFYNIVLTVFYSCVALPFAYLFFRHFFNPVYSLIGVSLLAFDYRLIINAGLGISEPLFLFFIWSACYFALRSDKFSFVALPLSAISIFVRFEGVLCFMFVIWVYITRKKYYFFLISFLLLIPSYFTKFFAINKVDSSQYNVSLGLIETHFRHEINFLLNTDLASLIPLILNGILYFGWSLVPSFLFFMPFGLYALYKKRFSYSLLLWLFIFVSIGIYAYLDAYDTRYFFMSFLFVALFCLYGLKEIQKGLLKINKKGS